MYIKKFKLILLTMSILFCLSTLVLMFGGKYKMLSLITYMLVAVIGVSSVIFYLGIRNEK